MAGCALAVQDKQHPVSRDGDTGRFRDLEGVAVCVLTVLFKRNGDTALVSVDGVGGGSIADNGRSGRVDIALCGDLDAITGPSVRGLDRDNLWTLTPSSVLLQKVGGCEDLAVEVVRTAVSAEPTTAGENGAVLEEQRETVVHARNGVGEERLP